MLLNKTVAESASDEATASPYPITRRQALIGLGVLGLSTIFGFGGIALNVKEAFATTIHRESGALPALEDLPGYDRVIKFAEEKLFSIHKDDWSKYGSFETMDADDEEDYYLFKWVFEDNFIMLGQDTYDKKISGWCLRRVDDAVPSNLSGFDAAELISSAEVGAACIAPTLKLHRRNAARDVFGNIFNVELHVDIINVATLSGYVNLKDTWHNGHNFIPVLVWSTKKKNDAGEWENYRGRTAILADGRPKNNSTVGLMVALGVEFSVSEDYFKGTREWFGPIPFDEWDDLHDGWEAVRDCGAIEGDVFFSWSDIDIADIFHSGANDHPYGRWEPFEESIGFMHSSGDWVDESVPTTDIWLPHSSLTNLQVSTNYSTADLQKLFRRESEEAWDNFSAFISGDLMDVRVFGSKGASAGPYGTFLSKTPFKNYSKTGQLLHIVDGKVWSHFGFELFWTGSSCSSNIKFVDIDDVWVDVRIVKGTGEGTARWPGGGWCNRYMSKYSRRYYKRGMSPVYSFEAEPGSRIDYIKVIKWTDYDAYPDDKDRPWETLTLDDFMARSHTFTNINTDWRIKVRFVRNAGRLEIYKHDAEMADHTAQGDGVLGGNTAFAAGHTNSGATFKLWKADNSEFMYKNNSVSSVTVKVSSNSPNDPAVFDEVEVGDYLWSEITAPDGYRAPTTTTHTVTITPYDKEGDEVVVTETNAIKRGNLNIRKVDADTGRDTPQGDARFVGATFSVKNVSAQPIMYNGRKIAVGAIVGNAVIESGNVATMRNLPYGRYEVNEIASSTLVGYDYVPTNAGAKTVEIREDNTTVTVSDVIRDPVWRGGVAIQKVDSDQIIAVDTNKHKIDLDWDSAQGNAELAGAEFKIFSISASYVHVGGHTYEPRYHSASDIKNPATAADCLVTLITDAHGRARTNNNVLPYGTYVIFETKPPAGYHTNAAFAAGVTFTIREKGGMVLMEGKEGWKV